MFIFSLVLSRPYPIFYNPFYDAYWTPFVPGMFDTLVEVQIECNNVDAEHYA